jgi:tRNA threonylcarbamoyladenosine biosynthesis protein TsaE
MAVLHSLTELQNEAARFVETLSPQKDRATVVTLSGELGAGKTSFTQGVAKTLGVTEAVTSPTFVLEKIYALTSEKGRGFTHFIHIDAYRLKDAKELHALGFENILKEPSNLIFLEWPERVEGAFELTHQNVSFSVREDGGREVLYTSHG